ncbi:MULTISPECIES: MogA/MoaB family molybdenum cofactor biosynthesis protein [Halomicrobium]|uniref:Molybdenum cofactor synthesis domain protein n=2 Tax=Halomicrobium mukohataei TaxID=57705 RepID=C7P0R3_HALMD|nr:MULTISPECIES: molybdenum cofactor biosynthesis protein B [Halomicrobium]ACV47045.1 molybdenum cofactor synthesis domain protein [Halomicrobium mukohataei DSM 12286]QCD65534.1 molybdenum cofactor biosynthesis protein MoaB [Halomicrobium mukohataei]QFR20340.1 molybdenum cofactor biosynthesis protein MoaB [Halomicrobium sp. ZPS1]
MSDEHGHDHGDGEHGHHHHHGTDETLAFAVLTISSSRSSDEDESGPVASAAIEDAGHRVAVTDVVADDAAAIRERVETLAGERAGGATVDVIVTTGGTGLTPDDVTIEAVRPLLDPEIPGIGEYFRRLSHEQVGTAAMLTRATAGIVGETAVYAFPGSPDAIALGVEDVLLPEIGHVVGLAGR